MWGVVCEERSKQEEEDKSARHARLHRQRMLRPEGARVYFFFHEVPQPLVRAHAHEDLRPDALAGPAVDEPLFSRGAKAAARKHGFGVLRRVFGVEGRRVYEGAVHRRRFSAEALREHPNGHARHERQGADDDVRGHARFFRKGQVDFVDDESDGALLRMPRGELVAGDHRALRAHEHLHLTPPFAVSAEENPLHDARLFCDGAPAEAQRKVPAVGPQLHVLRRFADDDVAFLQPRANFWEAAGLQLRVVRALVGRRALGRDAEQFVVVSPG